MIFITVKENLMKAVFQKTDDFGLIAKRIKNFKGFPPMFHSHLELIYIIKGEIAMTVDGNSRTLREGEMSVLFPYLIHSYEHSPNAEIFMLLFEPQMVEPFENELATKKPICPFLSDAEDFESSFHRITYLAEKDNEVSFKTACAHLQALIGELLMRIPLCDVEKIEENMTKPILRYCAEHFSDEDISIKKIADALYISQSYVSKVFSGKLKYGFREYINELRISKAKELLRKTDMKIVNVMLECGFKNQSSFNRIFGEICGVSPKEYRLRGKSKHS